MLARVSSPLTEWWGKCWPGFPLHLPNGEEMLAKASSPLTDWWGKCWPGFPLHLPNGAGNVGPRMVMEMLQGFLSTYRMVRKCWPRSPLHLPIGEGNVGQGFLSTYRMVWEMLARVFLSTYQMVREMLAPEWWWKCCRVSSPLTEGRMKCWPGFPIHLPNGEGNVGQGFLSTYRMVREMLAKVSSVSSAFHLPETLLRVTAVWNMHESWEPCFSFLRTDHAIIIDSVGQGI